MLASWWNLVAAVANGAGLGWYIWSTARRSTRPHLVSWFLWAAVPLLAGAIQLSSGVGLPALLPLVAGTGALVVFLVAARARDALWRPSRFDLACGLLSVVATALWLLTPDRSWALVAAIVADALAAVPTVGKAIRQPASETPYLYGLQALAAALTLATLHRLTLLQAGFAVYALLLCLLLTALTMPARAARRPAPAGPVEPGR